MGTYMTEAAAEGSTNAEGKVLGLPYSMEDMDIYIIRKYLRQQELTGKVLKRMKK